MPLHESAYVSEELYERSVRFPDGNEYKVHFREPAGPEIVQYYLMTKSDNDEDRKVAVAKLLVASVMEPDGKPSMTFEQAKKLRPMMSNALLQEVMQISGAAGAALKKPSPSGEQSGSGTSSPSPLAAVPSRSGRHRSSSPSSMPGSSSTAGIPSTTSIASTGRQP